MHLCSVRHQLLFMFNSHLNRPTTQTQRIQEAYHRTAEHLLILQLTLLVLFFLTEYTMLEHNNEGLLAHSIKLTSHIFMLGVHQLAWFSPCVPLFLYCRYFLTHWLKCTPRQTKIEKTNSVHTAASHMNAVYVGYEHTIINTISNMQIKGNHFVIDDTILKGKWLFSFIKQHLLVRENPIK